VFAGGARVADCAPGAVSAVCAERHQRPRERYNWCRSPGTTVEVASPVLIEKVRTAVSDESGRYTIVDLRPGTYSVTVTLPGFNTYKQEGLEVPANFTATVNVELRVGALEEAVTVTGATPVVDVQNTQRQVVLNRELMDAVPTPAATRGSLR
jgi:carboxypeptidase family protein